MKKIIYRGAINQAKKLPHETYAYKQHSPQISHRYKPKEKRT